MTWEVLSIIIFAPIILAAWIWQGILIKDFLQDGNKPLALSAFFAGIAITAACLSIVFNAWGM